MLRTPGWASVILLTVFASACGGVVAEEPQAEVGVTASDVEAFAEALQSRGESDYEILTLPQLIDGSEESYPAKMVLSGKLRSFEKVDPYEEPFSGPIRRARISLQVDEVFVNRTGKEVEPGSDVAFAIETGMGNRPERDVQASQFPQGASTVLFMLDSGDSTRGVEGTLDLVPRPLGFWVAPDMTSLPIDMAVGASAEHLDGLPENSLEGMEAAIENALDEAKTD